jgi:hypothetical protein
MDRWPERANHLRDSQFHPLRESIEVRQRQSTPLRPLSVRHFYEIDYCHKVLGPPISS